MVDRFYDPTTSTFLTRDPANPITRSAYGYVYGNPLNGTDPTGLFGFRDLVDSVVPDDLSGVGSVVRQVVNNAPIGGYGPSINSVGQLLGSGGSCHSIGGGHTECDGAPLTLGRPYTVGDVVINPDSQELDSDGQKHEINHSNQWAMLGPLGFLSLYGLDQLQAEAYYEGRGSPSGCSREAFMWLEQAAGLGGGGYSRECSCPE